MKVRGAQYVAAIGLMVVAILAELAWMSHTIYPAFGDLIWYRTSLPALLGDAPLYDPATLNPHIMALPAFWNQAPSLAPFTIVLADAPWLWIGTCLASLVVGLVLIWPRVSPAVTVILLALLLLSDPMRSAIWFANVNTVVFALLAVALRFPRYAGWAIGLAAAIKLVPLLGVAWLIGKRDWRGAGIAVGVLVALTGVTVVLEGPSVIPDFIAQRLNEYDPAPKAISLYAFGFSPVVGYVLAAVLSVLAVRYASFSLAVIAMLVSVPILHSHYWIWLLVPVLGIWLPWLRRYRGCPSPRIGLRQPASGAH